jgi:alkyldihydroxyacetonephosphate synthase
MRRRRFWGWGFEDEGADPRALAAVEAQIGALLGRSPVRREPPVARDLALPAPRVAAPPRLAHLCTATPEERARHALGRSYKDLARAIRCRFDDAPDYVAYPETSDDVARLLEAAAAGAVAVVPFGGGTSVAGGVEPRGLGSYAGVVSLDMSKLSRLLDLDTTSLSARIEAGASGPEIEALLKPHGLTLRFYPQSFELSTLGGWIATRAGGHFATGPTHVDDLVESVRVSCPRGTIETRRLPGSGAGPAPERLFLGSEGTLGVITDAWVRVLRRPTHRAQATVSFPTFEAATTALRTVLQSGLSPSNARALDPVEAMMSGAGPAGAALLLLAFESAHHPVDGLLALALEAALSAGAGAAGPVRSTSADGGRDAAQDVYKASFLRAPYLRDELVLRGVFVETYETAVTWDRLAALDADVRAAVARLDLGPHLLACRVTHAYPNGCAPYYTLVAPAPEADLGVEMWDDVKAAVTGAIVDAGGTSTHHHAIGRDVVPWYERERPALFADAILAAKRALDPRGIMNPGVLFRAGTR